MITKLMERRRFIRHPLNFPLEYRVIEKEAVKNNNSKGERTTTVNVSQGGLLFLAKRPVKMASTVAIKMPFQNKVFKVRAKVVHCVKSLDTDLYNIGVSFYRLNDAFKAKLIEQIYLISEYRDLRTIQLGREISLEEASREWIKRYSDRFRRLYW